MSINLCPYDGNFCQKMEARFDAWQKVILQSEGIVVRMNPDVFAHCPEERAQDRIKNCERYYGYLIAMRNTVNTIRQELEKRNINEQ